MGKLGKSSENENVQARNPDQADHKGLALISRALL